MTFESLIQQWEAGRATGRGLTAFTSGSTGTPKQIELPRRVVEASAARTIRHFGIDSSWHLHSCISPDFIGGKMMAIRACMAGCRFTYEEPSNHPRLTRPLPDMVSVVPSQMWHIVRTLGKETTSYAQHVKWLVGGQSVAPDLAEAICETGMEAYESYGMTETASHIALRRVSTDNLPFTPMPGIEIYSDRRGCLTIKLPESNHHIVTNDLCTINADKSFRILGRADNVIISGGRKIIPEEIENTVRAVAMKHGATEVMVSSHRDEKWGQAVVLLIEYGGNVEHDISKMFNEIDEVLQNNLPRWKHPKSKSITPLLPRTANGKILRV